MENSSSQIMKKETLPGGLASNIYPVMSANPQTSWLVTLRDFANVIFLLGSATYGMHFLWKVSKEIILIIHPWLKKSRTAADEVSMKRVWPSQKELA